MALILSCLRWGWLLSFALLLPIALPAGGAQINRDQIGRFDGSSQIGAGVFCEIRVTPSTSSRVLRTVSIGTPIKILRTWESPLGVNWFHIQISSLPLIDLSVIPKRGWVKL